MTLSGSPGADLDSLAKQRRKLAVLVVLALSRRPVSRDTLIEMFWGERDERRARHSLSEALSHLRRLLGADAIALRGTDVSLAPTAPLLVDALALTAAAERKDDQRVLELYGGRFLDGVYVEGSVAFDEWVERERRRLDKLFVDACARRTHTLIQAGDWDASIAAAQRWLDADPLSEPALQALLDALLAPGTPQSEVRALQTYTEVEQSLARSFELEPPTGVRARIEQLRARRAARQTTPAQTVREDHAEDVTDSAPVPVSMPAEAQEPAARSERSATTRRRPRLRRALLATAAVAGVFIAVALAWSRRSDPPATSTAVAVLPFAVRGPADYGYLREGVVDLLSANLEGAGPFRTVDPRAVLALVPEGNGVITPAEASSMAARLGAGLYVRGEVVVAGERLRVSASLYDRRWGSDVAAQAAVEGAPGELFKLVDQLTAQLLAGSARVTPEPMGRLAALTTHSLPALKHFLRGETEFRRGHYTEAFEAFRLATAADSTFALAHFRLAHAANWAVPLGWTWDSLTARSRIALDHADRLSTRPKLLVQGYHAWLIGEYDEAERAYRAVVQGYPDEVEGWYQLGEVMFHTNPVRGRSILEAGEPFTRVLSLAPEHLGALTHLVRVRAREERRGALDSLLTRITELSPPERRAEFRVLRAFLLGDESDQARAKAELRSSGNDEMVRATAHRIAVYGGRLDAASALLELLLDPGLPADVRGHAHLWMADLEVAQGRWRAAREHHSAAAALDRATALERRALHEALPFGPGSVSHLRAVRDELRSWDAAATPPTQYPWLAPYNGLHAPFREYLLGVVALRLDDGAETQRHAAALDALNAPAAVRAIAASLAESLRGQIAMADGRDREALARLDRGRLRIGEGLLETELGSQPLERWARAELLRRRNSIDDAADWYQSLPEISIAGLVYLAPVHLRLAQIADARGRNTDAVRHYGEFIRLWQNADPELQGTVADARRRFAELRGDSASSPTVAAPRAR